MGLPTEGCDGCGQGLATGNLGTVENRAIVPTVGGRAGGEPDLAREIIDFDSDITAKHSAAAGFFAAAPRRTACPSSNPSRGPNTWRRSR